MWAIKNFFRTELGQIIFHLIWAGIILFEFWLQPVLIFPTMLFKIEVMKFGWNPFKMNWRAWKDWLIPTAIYIPFHLAIFG